MCNHDAVFRYSTRSRRKLQQRQLVFAMDLSSKAPLHAAELVPHKYFLSKDGGNKIDHFLNYAGKYEARLQLVELPNGQTRKSHSAILLNLMAVLLLHVLILPIVDVLLHILEFNSHFGSAHEPVVGRHHLLDKIYDEDSRDNDKGTM